MRKIVIDQHEFHVPDKYLVKRTIPWLPSSQHDGLHFYVNPDAPPQEKILVGVQSAASTCSPETVPTSTMLASKCGVGNVSPGETMAAFETEKFYPHKDATFEWEYRIRDKGGNFHTVAICTTGGRGGICQSLNRYKDLIYSVGISGDEVRHLPTIFRQIHDMLSGWDAARSAS